MDNIIVQLPKINLEQKNFILKALNYYKISSVEFSFDSDDVIFQANNISEILDLQSNIITRDDREGA